MVGGKRRKEKNKDKFTTAVQNENPKFKKSLVGNIANAQDSEDSTRA